MEFPKEEVLDMVIKQNDFIKQFSLANNIGEHFKVLVVRPTKNDPSKFQAFVSLSNCLRDFSKQFKDKLNLGLSSCKVYDQYHIKRCNRCQQFGHYYKDCTAIGCCAKCGGDHPTNTCESAEKKCINCFRDGVDTQDHCTYHLKCPSLLKQQELLKQKNREHYFKLETLQGSNDNIPKLHCSLWNVCSLKNKLPEVTIEHVLDNDSDLFFITETWLTAERNKVTADFKEQGYILKHNIRNSSKKEGGGGGVVREYQ